MASGSVSSSKRRRTSTGNIALQGRNSLSDLPGGILAHAASFLAAPSKLLFAIALDDNSAVMPNERSSAIVGNNWDILDFGGVEKRVTRTLTDKDITRVLQCIDAINNVKRLKLTNCTNITGTCLEPLRGSLIIEQIDLSLVGNESPDLNPKPPISFQHVLPILDSIIGREGCQLKHIHFPSVWRKEPSTDSEFHAFILRYNEMYANRGAVHCLKCNHRLPEDGEQWAKTSTEACYLYGTHWYTCYGCLEHYCYYCDIGDGGEMLHDCCVCGRDYCKVCSDMTECSGSSCAKKICNDCYKYECVNCHKKFCLECVEKGNHIDKCDYCDKFCCQECYDYEATDIYTCSRCDVKFKRCDDCRLRRYRQGQLHCTQCIESLERKQLQEENKQLKVKMEELNRENKELKLEIKELKLENEELRSGNIE